MKQKNFIFKNTGKELEETGILKGQNPEKITVYRSDDKIYVNKEKCTPRLLLEFIVQELCMEISDDMTEKEIAALSHDALETWETVRKNLEE